jgi:hypothetical protein
MEVLNQFSFLKDLGFADVRSEATFVRYESSSMAINVYHGRLSYEIGLELESLREPIETYQFSALLRLLSAQRAKDYRVFASRTVDGVTEGVQRLAVLFRECVGAGNLNDPQLFAQLKMHRDEWSRKYALEVQLAHAHGALETAWAKKDFGKVVQILHPLREHLSGSDIKKLVYATKQAPISTRVWRSVCHLPLRLLRHFRRAGN